MSQTPYMVDFNKSPEDNLAACLGHHYPELKMPFSKLTQHFDMKIGYVHDIQLNGYLNGTNQGLFPNNIDSNTSSYPLLRLTGLIKNGYYNTKTIVFPQRKDFLEYKDNIQILGSLFSPTHFVLKISTPTDELKAINYPNIGSHVSSSSVAKLNGDEFLSNLAQYLNRPRWLIDQYNWLDRLSSISSSVPGYYQANNENTTWTLDLDGKGSKVYRVGCLDLSNGFSTNKTYDLTASPSSASRLFFSFGAHSWQGLYFFFLIEGT